MLPVNATLTTVTETYVGQDGTAAGVPASGTITFRPTNSIYVNDPANAIFVPDTVSATLDVSGHFSVQLVAADNVALNPTGWTYDVTETFAIGSTTLPPRTYSISVPSTGPVRLSSIAPVPPSGGTGSGIVTQVNGRNPDSSGHVTLVASDVGAYVKPGSGIPSMDLATAVQTELTAAGTAVQPARQLLAGTGMSGGGDLSVDRSLSVVYGTTAGTAAQGNDARIGGALQGANNLSDLPSASAARTNLALGNSATRAVGTTAGTVAAGDDSRITGAEQTANKGAASGYAGLDSTSRVPAANSALASQLQTLTYAATVTTDVSTGNLFRVTLTGNLILANPTNGVDCQKALWQFAQDSTGSRTLTLGSAFNLGPNTVTLSTGPNKVDYMLAIYRSAASKWDILAFGAGY